MKYDYKWLQRDIIEEKRKWRGHKNKDWKKRWKNLVKYDWDWDYDFMFAMLLLKLRYMLEYFQHSTIATPETYKEMTKPLEQAVALGNKIVEEKYNDAAMKFSEEHCYHMHANGCCWGEWDTPENHKVWTRMLTEAENKRQADINKFFQLIAENYRMWWD